MSNQTQQNKQNRTREEPNFETRAFFSSSSYNEKDHSVDITLTTEKAYKRYDYWEDVEYDEVLAIAGAEYPEKMPLLDCHNRSTVNNVFGSIINIKKEASAIIGKALFSSIEEAQKAETKVKEGHLTDISIGYNVSEFVRVAKGSVYVFQGKEYKAETREIRLVTKYRIFEGSFTPVGANDEAKVRSLQNPGVKDMAEEPKNKEPETKQPEAPQADAEKIRAKAIEDERNRISEVTSLCRTFEEDPTSYINQGFSIEKVREAIFEKERIRRASKTPTSEPASLQMGRDSADKTREYIENSLALRMNIDLPHAKTEANNRSLIDLAREFLRSRGIETRYMDNVRVAKMALQRSFSHSTSDFSLLLAGVTGKRLMKAYNATKSTWEKWCYKNVVQDFKTQHIILMGMGGDLELTPEGKPYKETTFSQSEETYALGKYGKMFSMTWEAFVNDDLRYFERTADFFGIRARRKPNALAYAILTANANLSDGKALFHNDHNNLGSAALSYDAYSAAKARMRKQKDPDGVELNLEPEFLLVPSELETTALELSTSQVKPSATYNSKNVFAGSFEVVSESVLSSHSATAWYQSANSNQIDTVEVAFLAGYENPVVEEEQGFAIDGRTYKVVFPCAAKAINHRGLQKGNA